MQILSSALEGPLQRLPVVKMGRQAEEGGVCQIKPRSSCLF